MRILLLCAFRLLVHLTCLGIFLHCWSDYFSLVLCKYVVHSSKVLIVTQSAHTNHDTTMDCRARLAETMVLQVPQSYGLSCKPCHTLGFVNN